MTGPLLNLTIFTKSTPHALRAICLASFPPAFLILLIQGIVSERVLPAIGILPLFLSSAFSALLLANEKTCGCQSSGLTGTPVLLVFDIVLGTGLLMCLILSWVFMSESDMIMLGTYGTNFLICNFLVHLYFVGKQLQDALTPGSSYPMSCPHCHHSSFSVGKFQISTGVENGYTPLVDNDQEPSGSAIDARMGGNGNVV